MRDYMPPAVKHVTKVIPHPSAIMATVVRHRALSFAVATTLLVVAMSALMLAKNSFGAQSVHNDAVSGTTQPSLDTIVTNNGDATQPVANGGSTVSDSSNGGSSTSETKSTVTVNNQQINVPQNGSVTKTISNGNGTTTVNVTSNSSNNGDSNSNTSSSLNVNTSTFSNTSGTSFNSSNTTQ